MGVSSHGAPRKKSCSHSADRGVRGAGKIIGMHLKDGQQVAFKIRTAAEREAKVSGNSVALGSRETAMKNEVQNDTAAAYRESRGLLRPFKRHLNHTQPEQPSDRYAITPEKEQYIRTVARIGAEEKSLNVLTRTNTSCVCAKGSSLRKRMLTRAESQLRGHIPCTVERKRSRRVGYERNWVPGTTRSERS